MSEHFRYHSLQLNRIIQGIAASISEYTTDIHHLKPFEAETEIKTKEEKVLDLSNQITAEDECIDLAKHLSAVLNSSHIPDSLKKAKANGISDVGNPNDELVKFVDSPENIAKALCEEKENQQNFYSLNEKSGIKTTLFFIEQIKARRSFARSPYLSR